MTAVIGHATLGDVPRNPTLRDCRVLGELVNADVPVGEPGDYLELTTIASS
jgi:hypothetical protein